MLVDDPVSSHLLHYIIIQIISLYAENGLVISITIIIILVILIIVFILTLKGLHIILRHTGLIKVILDVGGVESLIIEWVIIELF